MFGIFKKKQPTATDGVILKPSIDAADRDLEAKFTAFKKQHAGKTLHDAAKVVRDFAAILSGLEHIIGEMGAVPARVGAETRPEDDKLCGRMRAGG
jgi:hypothetical protein